MRPMKLLIFLVLGSINMTFASTKVEVKILYPCEALSKIPHEKEERMMVTFIDTQDALLYKNGLILRQRKSLDEEDVTLKKRWAKNEIKNIDPKIYEELADSSNGKLKCELDMTYHPENPVGVDSCSFTSPGEETGSEYDDFLQMIHSSVAVLPNANLRRVDIESRSWKIPVSGFNKRPELEMWIKGDQCILEASGKFESQKLGRLEVMKEARAYLFSLRDSLKVSPATYQVSKTAWALGLEQ